MKQRIVILIACAVLLGIAGCQWATHERTSAPAVTMTPTGPTPTRYYLVTQRNGDQFVRVEKGGAK